MGGPGSGRKKGGGKKGFGVKAQSKNVKMKTQSGIIIEAPRGGKIHSKLIKEAKFKKRK